MQEPESERSSRQPKVSVPRAGQRVELVGDVAAHDEREDGGQVAVLGEEQVELLPPPGHEAAGEVGLQRHLGVGVGVGV